MTARITFLALLLNLPGVASGQAGRDNPFSLATLNQITGGEPLAGALKVLNDDKELAKKLIAQAVPLAKNKGELSYNAAFVLGLLAAEMKDLKSAEALLRVTLEHAITTKSLRRAATFVGMVDLYYENKQYVDAARVAKELLALRTYDGTPGTYLRAVGKGPNLGLEEDEPFDLARFIKPDVYQRLIQATSKQGKHNQAIKLVDEYIEEFNQDGKRDDLWRELRLKGWVYSDAGRHKEAAQAYRDAIAGIAKDPVLPKNLQRQAADRIRYELSHVYVDMNDIDKATNELQTLIKNNAGDPKYYNDLGYIWADHDRNIDEAEKLVEQALDLDRKLRQKIKGLDPKLDKDNGAYLDSLAWVYFKQKKYEQAKEIMLKVLEDKDSQHIEIYDHLAEIHLALGDSKAAMQAWEQGLKHVTDSRRDEIRRANVEKKLMKLRDGK